MTTRYNIGVVKIPAVERDIIQSVPLRGFIDILGADTPDDDEIFPVGTNTTYSLELTDEEANDFNNADNCRYIEEEVICYPAYGVGIPRESTRIYSGYPGEEARWHGRDITIAICDTGTTEALRAIMNYTLVARQFFSTDPAPAEVWANQYHGCWVAGCGVPYGGRLIDAMMTDANGSTTSTIACQAFVWCADQGAELINYSFASNPAQIFVDTIEYLATKGVHLWACAGNDGLANYMRAPGVYCTDYDNVHCVGNFSEVTNARNVGSTPSNYHIGLTGVSAGAGIATRGHTGLPVNFTGTSASTPNSCLIHAKLMTGHRFSADECAVALRTTGRKSGQPATEEGSNGIFDFARALAQLGGFAPDVPILTGRNECSNPSCKTVNTGWSGLGTSVTSGRVTGIIGMSKTTGYRVINGPSIASLWLRSPYSITSLAAHSGVQWSFVLEGKISATDTVGMQVYSTDASDVETMQATPNISRNANEAFTINGVFTLPIGTVKFRVMMLVQSYAPGENAVITKCRWVPGNFPALEYADGDSVGWNWDNGSLDGNSTSGPIKHTVGVPF